MLSTTFVVPELAPAEAFYRRFFDAQAENSGWYLLLRFPSGQQLAFMTPRHPFQQVFARGSANLNLRVDDVDAEHRRLAALHAPISEPPTDKPYGQRSFTLFDPHGLCLYIHHERPTS